MAAVALFAMRGLCGERAIKGIQLYNASKIKEDTMAEIMQLEIQKEEHKEQVAAILVMNGYTVRKVKVQDSKGGKGKYVLQAWKE